MTVSLKERPFDLLYVGFFVLHFPVTFFMDLPGITYAGVLPSFFHIIPNFYLRISGDPMIAGTMGLHHGVPGQFTWFRTFIVMEGLCQLPMFIIGIYMIKNNSPYAPLLLMLYGAHVTTTVVPILATFWAIPTTVANAVDHSPPFSSISSLHLLSLFLCYIPWLAIPLAMTIDGTMRMIQFINRSQEVEKSAKTI